MIQGKGDDESLRASIISLRNSMKSLLTSSIPNVKFDLSVVSEESHRMYFDTESSDVFFLKLTSQMALYESSLTSAAITDKHEFEFWNLKLSFDPKIKLAFE